MEINIKASKIDLSDQNLDRFPEIIYSCRNLQKLILRNNRIKNIPKEIVSLKRLRMLDLSNNRIESLYAKLFSLTNLETLYLNQNKFKSIPSQVGQLSKLRKFSVSGNKIRSLPKEFVSLINLEFLNISSNPFDDFPLEILRLKSLKSLRIANINFKKFPTEKLIKGLPKLSSIYCFSTHIQQFRTKDINRDYLFLATFRGNCLQRLKSLLELSNVQTPALITNNIIISSKEVSNERKIQSRSINYQEVPKNIPNFRNTIFICYSHSDEKWRREVETSITSMQYEGIEVDIWSDKRIKTSNKWKDEIFQVLSQSSIALLLVSKYFLASEFIQNHELPKILERASCDDLRVMSIIISHCRFTENKKISIYQSLNPPDTPLLSMEEDKRDLYLYKLTQEIEHFIKIRS
jgi:Leucine-rich repeat (LRR) protein